MAQVVLITGGCRSGKSRYARQRAEKLAGPRAFVATCPALDDEMRQRIARHQEERRDRGWETIEETTELAASIGREDEYEVLLIDCVTLWVNNLMYEARQREGEVDQGEINEDEIARAAEDVLLACRRRRGTVFFVTNEVGMGIVPDNALARKYRDLVGRCNQTIAAGADEVTLVTCGIPMTLKQRNERNPA